MSVRNSNNKSDAGWALGDVTDRSEQSKFELLNFEDFTLDRLYLEDSNVKGRPSSTQEFRSQESSARPTRSKWKQQECVLNDFLGSHNRRMARFRYSSSNGCDTMYRIDFMALSCSRRSLPGTTESFEWTHCEQVKLITAEAVYY